MRIFEQIKEVFDVAKKEKKLEKISKETLKVLKKNKYKCNSGKIKIARFTKTSVAGAKCEYLGNIENNEKKSISNDIDSIILQANAIASIDYLLIDKKAKTANDGAIVVVKSKKNATDFDMGDTDLMGDILRSSNMISILKGLNDKLKDKLKMTDKIEEPLVLYIPSVLFFKDPYDGLFFARPKVANVIMIFEESFKAMKERIPAENDNPTNTIALNVVADILESSMKLGKTNIIVDPYDSTYLNRDNKAVSEDWLKAVYMSEKVAKNIDSIIFSVPSYDNFIMAQVLKHEIRKAVDDEDNTDVKAEVMNSLSKEHPSAIKKTDDDEDDDEDDED